MAQIYLDNAATTKMSKTAMKADCQTKIDEIQKQIINNQDNQTQINKSNHELDKTAIIRVLEGLKKITNFEGEKVPKEILEQCVNKIVMVDKTHFKWYMRNFSSNEDDSVYSILQIVLTKDELEKPMASFIIGFEEAKEYHTKNCYGVKTHPEAWQDLHVEIYY